MEECDRHFPAFRPVALFFQLVVHRLDSHLCGPDRAATEKPLDIFRIIEVLHRSHQLKKHEMTPEMLVDREPILDDTVELMAVVDRFELPVKVSEAIYKKYAQ